MAVGGDLRVGVDTRGAVFRGLGGGWRAPHVAQYWKKKKVRPEMVIRSVAKMYPR